MRIRYEKESPKNKRILVAHEKHATRFFDARTDKALYASALKLIKERIDPEYGYIQDPGPMEEWVHVEALSDEQIANLPESYRLDALRKRKERNREILDWEKFKADYNDAKKAVKTRDGKLAFEVLKRRQDHEYENVEIEYLE